MNKEQLAALFSGISFAGLLVVVTFFALTLANINSAKRLHISEMVQQQSLITGRASETRSLIDSSNLIGPAQLAPLQNLRDKSTFSEELQIIVRDVASHNDVLLSNTEVAFTKINEHLSLVSAKISFQSNEEKLLRLIDELEKYDPQYFVRSLRITDNGIGSPSESQLSVFVELVGVANDET